MAAPGLSRAEFDALLRRAGLTTSETQRAELYAAWETLETLIARLRTPLIALEDEPAPIIDLEPGR
ncbi:MAG TPA: hypothetical protein VFA22_08720 [Stellaceae bacterium]|nr:hypothetical protein [Stellaceae bacterium]